MPDLLHLKDFGAVGDGKLDDTRAVQRAIDTAAEGPPLFIDPGTYRCTEPLLVGSRTMLEGAGAASVLLFPWRDQTGGSAYCLGNRARTNADDGDEAITLENFVIQGGTDGTPYGEDDHTVCHGISFRKAADVEVTGVKVRNVSGFGICNTGLVRATFRNCRIRGTGRDGITSFPLINENDPSFQQFGLEDIRIISNLIEDVGDDGIAVHAGTAVTVNRTWPPRHIEICGNTIYARRTDHPLGQGRGICISGATDTSIEGNDIRRTVSTGILIQSWERNPKEVLRSERITIKGNSLIDAAQSVGLRRAECGIQVKGADHVTITLNGLLDPADRGIDIRNATHIDISRNIISGATGKYALLASGGADPCTDLTVCDNLLIHVTSPALLLFQVDRATEARNRQSLSVKR